MKKDRENQLQILKKVEAEAERFFAQRETGKALPFWERRPLRRIGSEGLGAEGAIDLFVKEYSEGLALNSGSRFFGYVIGGVTPAALAGDWLTSLYDQNAFGEMDCMDRQIEDEAIEGLKDLLGLRADFTGSFTSGATMATTNALACGTIRIFVSSRQMTIKIMIIAALISLSSCFFQYLFLPARTSGPYLIIYLLPCP